MTPTALKQQIPSSPAYVFDRDIMLSALQKIDLIRRQSGCKVLYSIKSLPLTQVLQWLLPYVDGFSVSSLFEARLADEILAGQGSLHLTTPGVRPDEAAELTRLCSHISCNSLNQYRLFSGLETQCAAIGVRLNPALSFLTDERFDPCRPFSKLGIPLAELEAARTIAPIRGLHFHTVFSALDFEPLIRTLAIIRTQLGEKFTQIEWLNLGGGYLYNQIADTDAFVESVRSLKAEFDLDVFIEPGKAIVGEAGYLLTTVIDCITNDGKNIAVLDTSVNHHPEVFEYQMSPTLHEHRPNGRHSAILAGSTCLAGDIFGEYRFDDPLKMGDKLLFKQVGAYSLVKANRFNGYNLPDIYALEAGRPTLLKNYRYQDYRGQW